MTRSNSVSRSLGRASRASRRFARTTSTLSAITSGDPGRAFRRGRNIAVGRALGRAGVWRSLWGRW